MGITTPPDEAERELRVAAAVDTFWRGTVQAPESWIRLRRDLCSASPRKIDAPLGRANRLFEGAEACGKVTSDPPSPPHATKKTCTNTTEPRIFRFNIACFSGDASDRVHLAGRRRGSRPRSPTDILGVLRARAFHGRRDAADVAIAFLRTGATLSRERPAYRLTVTN